MSDTDELAQERLQNFRDVYRGNIPKRVPVLNSMSLEACAEYAGASVAEINWDMTKVEPVFDKVCRDFPSDQLAGGTRRYPSFYQILGSRPFTMGSTGTMQHPDVSGMEVEDYDALIENPLDTYVEKILPRLYTELDKPSAEMSVALAKGFSAWQYEMATVGAINAKMNAKYGYAAFPGGATTAPFDFLSDFFRGFTGISKDIRRCPEKIAEACEAMVPMLVKKGQLLAPSEMGMTIIPLHMGPYLRNEDFEKYYFPTLKKQVELLSEMGINVQLFVEADYSRFYDYLLELPEKTILRFEEGDPKQIKEKLGKKFIITGLLPISHLITNTKEECLNEVKELVDIMAPGGGYIFDTDKTALNISGNFAENMKAVLEWVTENATYSAGERAGNTEIQPRGNRSAEIISDIEAHLNSKYYTNWADYKTEHPELYQGIDEVIASKIMRFENAMFNFLINLGS